MTDILETWLIEFGIPTTGIAQAKLVLLIASLGIVILTIDRLVKMIPQHVPELKFRADVMATRIASKADREASLFDRLLLITILDPEADDFLGPGLFVVQHGASADAANAAHYGATGCPIESAITS